MNKIYSSLILPISMGILWLHAAQPTEVIKICHPVAEVFNKMVKKSLDESDKQCDSDIYLTLKRIDNNGIIEIGKKSKVVALTKDYQQSISDNPYVAKTLQIAAESGPSIHERTLAWRLIREHQCIALQDISRGKIPNLSLSLDITDIILLNSNLKLDKGQRHTLLATQLFFAVEMAKMHKSSQEGFNILFEPWVDDADGGCAIS